MKRALSAAFLIPIGLVVVILTVTLFHLGPLNIRPGDRFVLAHLSLKGGTEFFAVGHRTEFLTEPYEVTLYKVEPDRSTSLYYLAFEDSYWWNCSIRSNELSREIEVRADGGVVARYLPGKNLVISDAYKVPSPAYEVKYWQLEQLLAHCRR